MIPLLRIRLLAKKWGLAMTFVSPLFLACTSDKISERKEPQLFAADVISTGNVFALSFTPDGLSAYFTRNDTTQNTWHIYISIFERGRWAEPRVASFSGQYDDLDPFISPNGHRLYYMSNRPISGTDAKPDYDIWMVRKIGFGWSEPQNLGPEVNSEATEGYPTVSKDGTLYFFSTRDGGFGDHDIYRAKYVNGGYQMAENLGKTINTDERESNTYISPDEEFIIFNARREEGYGSADLYVSFSSRSGWTKPVNLGPRINSDGYEFCPSISPDGSKLYFSRSQNGKRNIYQVDLDATIITAK